jgi:hypothetical protein
MLSVEALSPEDQVVSWYDVNLLDAQNGGRIIHHGTADEAHAVNGGQIIVPDGRGPLELLKLENGGSFIGKAWGAKQIEVTEGASAIVHGHPHTVSLEDSSAIIFGRPKNVFVSDTSRLIVVTDRLGYSPETSEVAGEAFILKPEEADWNISESDQAQLHDIVRAAWHQILLYRDAANREQADAVLLGSLVLHPFPDEVY